MCLSPDRYSLFLVCVPKTSFVKPRQGYKKMKELEELMNGTGFFNEAHSLGLGDVLELSDSEGGDDNNNEDENSKAKPGKGQLPSIEGQEKCAEFVSKYKKAILARCRTFKDTSDRWNAEAPTSGRCFGKKLEYVLRRLFSDAIRTLSCEG